MFFGCFPILADLPGLRLEYLSPIEALLIFLVAGGAIVAMGLRSLAGLGPARKWVAIGVRLAVLLLVVLVLGNVNLVRKNTDLEVMVVRDISRSTSLVRDYPEQSLQSSLDNYLIGLAKAKSPDKGPNDRIGHISFNDHASIDALPQTDLALGTRAMRGPGTGTDPAAALQLALATLNGDAMHRLLLIWDGNATAGDLDAAVSAAAAQHVPIDVMPLKYDITDETMLDKMIAPTWVTERQAFTVEVHVRSTNVTDVEGNLTVTHNGAAMDLGGGQTTKRIKIKPGLNVERIPVPPQTPGVHQFHATIADVMNVTADVAGTGGGDPGKGKTGDTIPDNNSGDVFTFVHGKGKVLYVDNVENGNGKYLADALRPEGIQVEQVTPDQFPSNAVELQAYDAVILADVPRGSGPSAAEDVNNSADRGLSEDQDAMLAHYVHDMGGGLVMIGGPHTFGAGGWQGSKLEAELPVDMEVPAQRQIPKGALVLILDSAEVPDGNYWSEQCAMKAMETLSAKDEVGIITCDWSNGGKDRWDLPLQVKGDGSKFVGAVHKWGLGDLPSFEDAVNVALDGDETSKGLKDSDARQKHIVIITDDDPTMPSPATIQRCIDNHVTVSTITVYPHQPGNIAPGTREVAKRTGGRSFGPIENNPGQLPQIFIKEATVVKRSIIQEPEGGVPVTLVPSGSDLVKGIAPGALPPLVGFDLTTKKNNPLIEMPMIGGAKRDPIFAHWQAGLGKAAVFTGDAHNKWAAAWVGTPMFSQFWAQVVRGVSRPPMSSDFDIQMTADGDHGHITVEAVKDKGAFNDFLNIAGTVAGGDDLTPHPVHLVQTGPGTYEGDFDASKQGNYVTSLTYTGQNGQRGVLLSGTAVNSSPELRDLHSNPTILKQIAERTGGRVLEPFDKENPPDLFARAGLQPSTSPRPIWDVLIPILLGMILLDVAVRRIAWDWASMKRLAFAGAERVRSFTQTVRKVESQQVLASLKRVREEVSEQRLKPAGDGAAAPTPQPPTIRMPEPRPDPSAKFNAGAAAVEGDITQVVGGATNKPVPSAPKKPEPKGTTGSDANMGSLLEAKRRAQQKIREKEKAES